MAIIASGIAAVAAYEQYIIDRVDSIVDSYAVYVLLTTGAVLDCVEVFLVWCGITHGKFTYLKTSKSTVPVLTSFNVAL